MSIYVFCDLFPKLQIQLQQFTDSYNNLQRVIQTLIATGWNLWEILISEL